MDREQIVRLRVPGFSDCRVNLRGCTIVSWNVGNEELLYMNRLNVYNAKAFMRGGITLEFPHIGQWLDGPDYGFNSLQSWEIRKCPHVIAGGSVCAEFTTSDNLWTKSMWSQMYSMLYTVILSKRKLKCRLIIKNNNKNRCLTFKMKFLNYIRVPDISTCTLKGMEGCKFVENAEHENEFLRIDDEKSVPFTNFFNRVYIDVPTEFAIKPIIKEGQIDVKTFDLPDLEIQRSPDKWMVKPDEKDEDTMLKTICLGTGCIWKSVSIEPGCQKVYEQTMEYYTPHENS